MSAEEAIRAIWEIRHKQKSVRNESAWADAYYDICMVLNDTKLPVS